MANPVEQAGCYIPDPRYTFCFAPRHDLVCVICNDSKFKLPWNRERSRDSDPCLLPCGHAFGKWCLSTWLRSHNTCPVCRFELRYELCEHPILPRRLTKENVMFVPRTIPDGGMVGAQCSSCRWETDQRVAAELWMPLAKRYYEIKSAYERTGSEADRLAMLKGRRDLDEVMKELTPPEDRQW